MGGQRRDRSTSHDRKRERKERSRSRDKDDGKKEKKERRDKLGKSSRRSREASRSTGSHTEDRALSGAGEMSVQGSGSFNAQLGSSGFTQFPGQYGAPSYGPPSSPYHADLSAHVSDQFPGQNPTTFSAPYRPPLAVGEGGYGLAADYYGDQGQSVASQPGVRPQQPLVNAQPHLMAASAVPAPPVETGQGSASDYYGGDNRPAQKPSVSQPSTYMQPLKPQTSMPGSFDEPPAPAEPPRPPLEPGKSNEQDPSSKMSTAGAIAGGAALGYVAAHDTGGSHYSTYVDTNDSTSFFYQQASNSTIAGSNHGHSSSVPVVPTVGMQGTSMPNKPPRPGKHSSPSHSNTPGYAIGAAGLAAGANALHNHNQSHHHSPSLPTNGSHYNPAPSGPSSAPYADGATAMHHRHRDPISKLVDWWKDYEDVRRMEEYTEYIGVCRDCFDPRSSPGDAPRKHHYHKRRSGEFRSGRVDKESRYYSSDHEGRRKGKGKSSWIATGVAGYGLAKVGKAIWNQNREWDDDHSLKTGRDYRPRTSLAERSRSRSGDRRSHSHISRGVVRRRSHSSERVQVHATRDGKGYKARSHRSRSRSRSRDRRAAVLGATVGAAIGVSATAHERKKHRSGSKSPRREYVQVRRRHRSRDNSPERGFVKTDSRSHRNSRRSPNLSIHPDDSRSYIQSSGILGGLLSSISDKRRRDSRKRKGFFNFGNGSSSSSSSDSGLAYGPSVDRRRRTKRKPSDEKFNATLIGLGATAAALAAAQGGRDKHGQHRSELVAVRQRQDRHGDHPHHRRRQSGVSSPSSSPSFSDDEGWVDASDAEDLDESSVSSGLAFGEFDFKGKHPARKSQESLLSESSGAGKWGWRWGSRKKQKRRASSESLGAAPAASFAGAAIGVPLGRHESAAGSVGNVVPLQTVFPMPTSDPHSFDAVRRTGSVSSIHAQPLTTARPEPVPLQQPQPVAPVSSAVYTTQPHYQPSYSAPTGPPVFSNVGPFRTAGQRVFESPQQTSGPLETRPSMISRRGNSSPILRHPVRDAAIAGVAGAVLAGAMARGRDEDRNQASPSSVRFDLSRDHIEREDRENKRERQRRDDEDRLRADEAARHRHEEGLRQSEEQRQQAEAAQILERQRLEKTQDEVRQRQYEQEEIGRKAHEGRAAAESEDRTRLARQEAERKEAIAREAITHETAAHEEADRRHQEYESASLLREREKGIVRPENWDTPVAAGVAAGAAIFGPTNVDAVSPKEDRAPRSIREIVPIAKDDDALISDDVIFDRDYFHKARSRSASTNERQAVVARKAASMVVADLERRYIESSPPPDPAAFFAPPELSQQGGVKTTNPNPNADVELRALPAYVGHRGEPPYEPAYAFVATKYGAEAGRVHPPYPIPELNLIEPTPPHSVVGSVRSGRETPVSPLVLAQDALREELVEEMKREEGKGKGVTWGEPHTIHFEAHSPEGDKREYVEPKHLHRGESTKKEEQRELDEIVVELKSPGEGTRKTTYKLDAARTVSPPPESRGEPGAEVSLSTEERKKQDEAYKRKVTSESADREANYSPAEDEASPPPSAGEETPIFESHSPEVEPVVITPDSELHSRRGIYQNPFFETMSDLGLDVDQGVLPRRPGFVEGEVETPPAVEENFAAERASAPTHSVASRFVEEVETPPVERKDKASIPSGFAKPQHGFVEGAVETPTAEREVHMPGEFLADPEALPDVLEQESERPLSKKEKKNQDKAAKRETRDEVASLQEQSPVQTPVEAVEELEVPLSKNEKKKRDKAAKQWQGVGEVDSPTSESPTTPVAEVEEWDVPLSKKDKKKRERAAKRQELEEVADPALDSPAAPTAEAGDFDIPLSKKEKKKKAKAARIQDSEDEPVQMLEEIVTPIAEVEEFEIPLSKKVKKKRDKAARQRAFEDSTQPAQELATPTMEAEESIEPKKQPASSKGYDDAAAPFIEETSTSAVEVPPHIPGAFESPPVSRQASYAQQPGSAEGEKTVSVPSNAFDDLQELADAKKPLKKLKRKSGRFSSPTPGSPLRSEISFNDYVGEQARPDEGERMVSAPTTPFEETLQQEEPESYTYQPEPFLNSTREAQEATFDDFGESKKSKKKSKKKGARYEDLDPVTSPPDTTAEVVEVDRESPSVASEGRYSDGGDRKKAKNRKSKNGSEVFEPSDRDGRSIAASEPGGFYYEPSRKSKRKSKRGSEQSDDVASEVSVSAKYPEDEPSTGKKEKKGFFGLFSSRRSSDSLPELKSSAMRDDDDDDDDDDDREHEKKHKHRSAAYGSDENDDTRSSKSSDRKEKHKGREWDDGSEAGMDTQQHQTTKVDLPPFQYQNHPASRVNEKLNTYKKPETPAANDRHALNPVNDENQSFLGERAEAEGGEPLPGSLDVCPVLAQPDAPEEEVHELAPPDSMDENFPSSFANENALPALPASRPDSPTEIGRAIDFPSVPPNRSGSPAVVERAADLLALPASRSSSPIDVGSVADLPPLPASRPSSPIEIEIRSGLPSLPASRSSSPLQVGLITEPSPPPDSGLISPTEEVDRRPSASAERLSSPSGDDHDQGAHLYHASHLSSLVKALKDDTFLSPVAQSEPPEEDDDRDDSRVPQQNRQILSPVVDEIGDLPGLPASRSGSPMEVGSAVDLPMLPQSRPTSPSEVGRLNDLPALPASRPSSPYTPEATPRPALSPLQTSRAASTTAIPLRFRRPPSSPGVSRTLTMSTPTVDSPSSPLVAPRLRHTKSNSAEYKLNTQEFRPLYLVERNRKSPELEEALPSLPSSRPSSRTTSRSPSVQETEEGYQSALESPEQRFSDVEDVFIEAKEGEDYPARGEEDYLDSQQTTPKAASFPIEILGGSAEDRVAGKPQHSVPEAEPDSERSVPSPCSLESGVRVIEEPNRDSAFSASQASVDLSALPSLPDSRSSSPYDKEEVASSDLHDAAITIVAGGIAAALASGGLSRRDRGYDSDFMAGEADHDAAMELSDITLPSTKNAETEAAPVLPTLSRTSSKKDKKGKKGAKWNKTSNPAGGTTKPVELSAEEKRQLGEQDAQNAVDSWFEAPMSFGYKKGKKGSEARASIVDAPLAVDTARRERNEEPEAAELESKDTERKAAEETLAADFEQKVARRVQEGAPRSLATAIEPTISSMADRSMGIAGMAPLSELLFKRDKGKAKKKSKKLSNPSTPSRELSESDFVNNLTTTSTADVGHGEDRVIAASQQPQYQDGIHPTDLSAPVVGADQTFIDGAPHLDPVAASVGTDRKELADADEDISVPDLPDESHSVDQPGTILVESVVPRGEAIAPPLALTRKKSKGKKRQRVDIWADVPTETPDTPAEPVQGQSSLTDYNMVAASPEQSLSRSVEQEACSVLKPQVNLEEREHGATRSLGEAATEQPTMIDTSTEKQTPAAVEAPPSGETAHEFRIEQGSAAMPELEFVMPGKKKKKGEKKQRQEIFWEPEAPLKPEEGLLRDALDELDQSAEGQKSTTDQPLPDENTKAVIVEEISSRPELPRTKSKGKKSKKGKAWTPLEDEPAEAVPVDASEAQRLVEEAVEPEIEPSVPINKVKGKGKKKRRQDLWADLESERFEPAVEVASPDHEDDLKSTYLGRDDATTEPLENIENEELPKFIPLPDVDDNNLREPEAATGSAMQSSRDPVGDVPTEAIPLHEDFSEDTELQERSLQTQSDTAAGEPFEPIGSQLAASTSEPRAKPDVDTTPAAVPLPDDDDDLFEPEIMSTELEQAPSGPAADLPADAGKQEHNSGEEQHRTDPLLFPKSQGGDLVNDISPKQPRHGDVASSEPISELVDSTAIVAADVRPELVPLPADNDVDLERDPAIQDDNEDLGTRTKPLSQESSALATEESTFVTLLKSSSTNHASMPSQELEAVAEDEWAAPIGRKGKKGKKRTSAIRTFVPEVVDPESIALPETSLEQVDLERNHPESSVQHEVPLEKLPFDKEEPALLLQESSQPLEDERPAFTQKKGKKGKKKGLTTYMSASEPSSLGSVTVSTEEAGPLPDESLTQKESTLEEHPPQQQESPPEPDPSTSAEDGWVPLAKKKGKRGKNALKPRSPLPEPETVPAPEHLEAPKDQVTATPSDPKSVLLPGESSEEPELAGIPEAREEATAIVSPVEAAAAVVYHTLHDTSVISGSTKTETQHEQSGGVHEPLVDALVHAEESVDEFWAPTTDKKGKKGKKETRRSQPTTPAAAAEPEIEPIDANRFDTTMFQSLDDHEQRIGEREAEHDEAPTSAERTTGATPLEEDPEALWAPMTKKKGKKGNKGTHASVLRTPLTVVEQEQLDSSIAGAFPADPVTESTPQSSTCGTEQSTPVVTTPQHDEAEDLWDLPSKKRGKKGKKSQQSATSAPSPSVSLLGSSQPAASTFEQIREKDVQEEFGLPKSKKEKKKDKKKAKAAPATWDDPVIRAAELSRDETATKATTESPESMPQSKALDAEPSAGESADKLAQSDAPPEPLVTDTQQPEAAGVLSFSTIEPRSLQGPVPEQREDLVILLEQEDAEKVTLPHSDDPIAAAETITTDYPAVEVDPESEFNNKKSKKDRRKAKNVIPGAWIEPESAPPSTLETPSEVSILPEAFAAPSYSYRVGPNLTESEPATTVPSRNKQSDDVEPEQFFVQKNKKDKRGGKKGRAMASVASPVVRAVSAESPVTPQPVATGKAKDHSLPSPDVDVLPPTDQHLGPEEDKPEQSTPIPHVHTTTSPTNALTKAEVAQGVSIPTDTTEAILSQDQVVVDNQEHDEHTVESIEASPPPMPMPDRESVDLALLPPTEEHADFTTEQPVSTEVLSSSHHSSSLTEPLASEAQEIGPPLKQDPAVETGHEVVEEILRRVDAVGQPPDPAAQDFDFAATLAAGLQDSGFDPDIVINDPTFHRLASPSGVAPEADPEEFYVTTTKRSKKGKKTEQSTTMPIEPLEGSASPAMQHAEGGEDADTYSKTELGSMTPVLKTSLDESGFDPSLVLDDPVFGRMHDPSEALAADPDEFFTMQKPRKRKKGKKGQTIPLEVPAELGESLQSRDTPSYAQPTVDPSPVAAAMVSAIHEDTVAFGTPHTPAPTMPERPERTTDDLNNDKPALEGDESPARESEAVLLPPARDAPITQFEETVQDEWALPMKRSRKSKKLQEASWSDDIAGVSSPTNPTNATTGMAVLEPTMEGDNWNTSSKRKKSKGKTKETRGQAATSDVEKTEHPAGVPVASDQHHVSGEGLVAAEPTVAPHTGGILTDQTMVSEPADEPTSHDRNSRQSMQVDGPSRTVAPRSEAVLTSPTSTANKVAAVFPGLERVKRRAPSITQTPETRPESDSSFFNRRLKSLEPTEHPEAAVVEADRMVTTSADVTANQPGDPAQQASLPRQKSAWEEGHRHVTTIQPSWAFPSNRDSAVHVADSPQLSVPPHVHDVGRDSGYDDATTSLAPDEQEPDLHHVLEHSTPIVSTNSSSDPLKVSVEVDPDWVVPVSQEQPSSREYTGSGATPTPAAGDISPLPSDYLLQIGDTGETTLPALHHDASTVSVSPAESTTKDRTPYLFESSPSNREVPGSVVAAQSSIEPAPNTVPVPAAPTPPSFYNLSNAEANFEHNDLQRQAVVTESAMEDPPVASIFDGDALRTASESSFGATSMGRLGPLNADLDTVHEYDPESPPSKKGRAITDVGEPEHGVKSARRSATPEQSFRNRTTSPLPQSVGPVSPANKLHAVSPDGPISMNDPISHLSWLPPSDGKETASLHRHRPRDPSKRALSGRRTPSAGSELARRRVSDQRSPVLSDRSGDSISRFRTPEHLRPLSASSQRSGTPPLRRVDRSLSGDLRAASRLGEAKSRDAKPSLQANIGVPVAAAPPNIDRVNDKGNTRGVNMDNVYVSLSPWQTSRLMSCDVLTVEL